MTIVAILVAKWVAIQQSQLNHNAHPWNLMRPIDQQRRLLFAFTVSVLLHSLLLGAENFKRLFSAPPQLPAMVLLQARLLPPKDMEPLLKNTLNEAQAATLQSVAAAKSANGATPTAREIAIRSKLAEHLFYPQDAIARGIEGEVRLLLTLDPHGRILESRVAGSSGHALLDQAAVDAAHAVGRIPEAGVGELILPVVFKLQ